MLPQCFNTALDSACTNHIICERHFFQLYDKKGAVPVKTANCGFLNTLAIGDVKFCIIIERKQSYGPFKTAYMPPM
jgi:hypothetical protein